MRIEDVGSGRPALTAIVAGLVAAVFEMIFVLPVQGMMGASPIVVFQSIAYGFLGKAVFSQGLYAAALGLGVHLLISLVAAALYVLAALRWEVLIRRPIVSGLIYGVIVYLVMNFAVIPMSAIGFKPPKLGLLWLVSVAIHLFAFALPIALVCRVMLGSAAKGATTQQP